MIGTSRVHLLLAICLSVLSLESEAIEPDSVYTVHMPTGIPTEMVLIPEGEFIMGLDGILMSELYKGVLPPDLLSILNNKTVYESTLRQAVYRKAPFIPEDLQQLIYLTIFGHPDYYVNAVPSHRVFLDAFLIDRFEITNEQYDSFLAATGRERSLFSEYQIPAAKGAAYPVIGLTWEDANDYCQWAGKRLPTEAEWEKAARGTDGRMFPWGNRFFDDALNWADETPTTPPSPNRSNGPRGYYDGYGNLAPVGSFRRFLSPYGVEDMLGNAKEWVQDWYEAGFYSRSPHENPKGPSVGEEKVLRGGDWYTLPEGREVYRIAYRFGRRWELPSDPTIGARCARDANDHAGLEDNNMAVPNSWGRIKRDLR